MSQRFIQSFSTSGTEQEALDQELLGKPYIAFIEDGQYIDWNTRGMDYSKQPLTFEVISAGTITWIMGGTGATASTIQYSLNNGDWASITSTTAGTSFSISAGDIVRFKGNGLNNASLSVSKSSNLRSTGKVIAYGNPYSLLSTNYANVSSVGAYALSYLFSKNTGLISAEDLVLPATSIEAGAYAGMFYSCSNLVTGPKVIPSNYSYGGFNSMFRYCSNLMSSPDFTSTGNVENICLTGCFQDCGKLRRIKILATGLANNPGMHFTDGVASSGTFIKHPNMTSWPSGTSGIPTGWTVEDAEI